MLAIAVLRVPESRDEDASRMIDWKGALLATLGLGTLVYGLIRVQLADGRIDGGACIAFGAIVLALFVIVERREAHPMMPLTMFSSKIFSVANLYTFALYLALGGALYFFPYVLIDVQGYAPTAAGATFLPFVILQFAFSRSSGGLVHRFGARLPMVAGAALAGCAFLLYALPGVNAGNYWTTYFPAVLLLGIGATFFIAPLTTTVFDSSDPALSGVASGDQQRGRAHGRPARDRVVRHHLHRRVLGRIRGAPRRRQRVGGYAGRWQAARPRASPAGLFRRRCRPPIDPPWRSP